MAKESESDACTLFPQLSGQLLALIQANEVGTLVATDNLVRQEISFSEVLP
jgi:hypothetical protein